MKVARVRMSNNEGFMQTQDDIIKSQARCISHEIRNQISICDVYCEIIKKHLEKNNVSIPSVDNALSCIQKSAKMVNNTLLDLKSLSNYEYKIVDLNNLLFQSIELAKVYVHDKHIEISLHAAGKCFVNVDENKFLACIINLIKNAIEAIENDGWIRVETELFKDFVSVKISNNGEKISDEHIKNIFDEGLTTKRYGSGLGLYICKNNLKTMNADLQLVKSTETVTEFEIKLHVTKS